LSRIENLSFTITLIYIIPRTDGSHQRLAFSIRNYMAFYDFGAAFFSKDPAA